MTGDAEPPAQQALVASGLTLSAHVLKLPHHGSSRQDERFFQQSAATLAIASVGERNDYGHPAAKTVSLANKCGMKVLRTDQTALLQSAATPEACGSSPNVLRVPDPHTRFQALRAPCRSPVPRVVRQ